MNNKQTVSSFSVGVFTLLLGSSVATSAVGAELPKRKPGLWELRTQVQGMPEATTIQMCIDAQTDNLIQRRANDKERCSTMDVQRGPGKATIHAVCKAESSTVTMDGVYTGDFSSSYRSEMKMHYDPPMHGMSESHMSQEAKWLGPCKPGQKGGDVVMSNMGGFNMNEMLKNPRFQELTKQRQGH